MDDSLSHVLDYGVDEMVVGDRDHLWHHIKPHKCFQNQEQMIIVAGKGLTVTDIRGREYLDATSGGVWCVNVGYGRDSIADAVAAQMKKMPYFAGSVGTIPSIKLSSKLIELRHPVRQSRGGDHPERGAGERGRIDRGADHRRRRHQRPGG